MRVLVTGASGFVGATLVEYLSKIADVSVVAMVRSTRDVCVKANVEFRVAEISSAGKIAIFLDDIDVVVHTAGRAHIMNESSSDPLAEFRQVNTEGTLNLARHAEISGVKRFIFLSTIKVLGDKTSPGQPFKNDDPFNPQDPYSISKVEAEMGLNLIGEANGMEIVIIRPPLVYGQGVKGNFAGLLKLARVPIPLPFGAIENKRSLVSVENLADLIAVCCNHPMAKNQTFLISDEEDMSTPVLFSRIAEAGDRKAYIFRFPTTLISIFLDLLGKRGIYDRLCGSMQVDIDYTKIRLKWEPPFTVNSSLSRCWLLDSENEKGSQR